MNCDSTKNINCTQYPKGFILERCNVQSGVTACYTRIVSKYIILHLSPTNWNGNSGKVLHFISSRKRLHVIKRLHVGNYLTCNIVLTIPRVFFTIRWTNLPWLLNRFRWRCSTLMREWYCGKKLYIMWKRKWDKRVQQWCELISYSDSYHMNCYLLLQNNKY